MHASSGPSQLACHQLALILCSLNMCSRGAAATAAGQLMLRHCTCCRSHSEAKSSQLAEVTESKEGLEAKLEQLAEAHSMLSQQHEGLTTEMTQVQGALQTAEEGQASAEVLTTACAVHRQPVAQSTCLPCKLYTCTLCKVKEITEMMLLWQKCSCQSCGLVN